MGDESKWYSLVECMFHRTLVHVLSVHHVELSWGDVGCSVWFRSRAETPTTTHITTAQLNKCIDNTCTRVRWNMHSTNEYHMDSSPIAMFPQPAQPAPCHPCWPRQSCNGGQLLPATKAKMAAAENESATNVDNWLL